MSPRRSNRICWPSGETSMFIHVPSLVVKESVREWLAVTLHGAYGPSGKSFVLSSTFGTCTFYYLLFIIYY